MNYDNLNYDPDYYICSITGCFYGAEIINDLIHYWHNMVKADDISYSLSSNKGPSNRDNVLKFIKLYDDKGKMIIDDWMPMNHNSFQEDCIVIVKRLLNIKAFI